MSINPVELLKELILSVHEKRWGSFWFCLLFIIAEIILLSLTIFAFFLGMRHDSKANVEVPQIATSSAPAEAKTPATPTSAPQLNNSGNNYGNQFNGTNNGSLDQSINYGPKPSILSLSYQTTPVADGSYKTDLLLTIANPDGISPQIAFPCLNILNATKLNPVMSGTRLYSSVTLPVTSYQMTFVTAGEVDKNKLCLHTNLQKYTFNFQGSR
jgi:hypothetical protein